MLGLLLLHAQSQPLASPVLKMLEIEMSPLMDDEWKQLFYGITISILSTVQD